MLRVIFKATLFLIPLFLLALYTEHSIRRLPNSYKYKDRYVTENKDSIEVLILGNSQAQVGIIPDSIDMNCFSFAIDGQSLRYDLEIFEKYEKGMSKLQYIILPISNFSLYFEMSNTTITANRIINYPLYLKINTDEVPVYKRFESVSPGFRNKFIGYFKRTFLGEDINTCLHLGNSTQDIIGVLDKSAWKKRAKGDATWQLECINSAGGQILDRNEKRVVELVEKCKSKGIKVILVTPPVSNIYRQIIDNQIQSELDHTFNFCSQISGANNNVFYLNLYYSNEFEDKDYLNPSHLNLRGATKMSNMVNTLINSERSKV